MSPSREEKIIIIDDDELVSKVIALILEDDYQVFNYNNAEDAIKDKVFNDADLIITDVNLPGMDGIEFLGLVYKADPAIPVIVITGINDIDVAISALKNGAFDFILKPFKNDQILLSVQKGIERRKLMLENISLMEELKRKNSQLEILNKKIQARNYEIESELDIASNLQQCLFPIIFPEIEKIEFVLKYIPVEKISGDFFDFHIIDKNKFSFFFGDVSGHGVPAALYSAMVKTAISSISTNGLSPCDFLKEMNTFLIGAQRKMSYNYSTIFYGLFDLDKMTITYCNGGIPPPVIIKSNGDLFNLKTTGPFVGIFDTSTYTEDIIKLGSGDKLIFFTDGAFECTDYNGIIMGQALFLDILKKVKSEPIKKIITELYNEMEDYCVPESYSDDITILGMHIK